MDCRLSGTVISLQRFPQGQGKRGDLGNTPDLIPVQALVYLTGSVRGLTGRFDYIG